MSHWVIIGSYRFVSLYRERLHDSIRLIPTKNLDEKTFYLHTLEFSLANMGKKVTIGSNWSNEYNLAMFILVIMVELYTRVTMVHSIE